MPFITQHAIRREPPKQEANIFSGMAIAQVVGAGAGTPQTITLIGGVKGASETTAGVAALNTRLFTKLFLDYSTNTINGQAVLTPTGNRGGDFVSYTIPQSLDIPLARVLGDSFTLLTKCKINVYYTKNPNLSLWQGNVGHKAFTVKPGTYTLAQSGLLPSLPQIGLNNQEVITFVSIKSIPDVPIGVLTNSPFVFTRTFSQDLTSNYFTLDPVTP